MERDRQVRGDGLVDHGGIDLRHAIAEAEAGGDIVDENVDRQPIQQLRQRLRVGRIEGMCLTAGLLCQSREPIRATGDGVDRQSRSCQGADDGGADAARRTGHQDGLIAVHDPSSVHSR